MFKAGIGPQAIITWTSTSWREQLQLHLGMIQGHEMTPPNSNNPQKHQLQYPSWMPFPVLPSKHFGWAFTLRPPGNLIKGLLKRTASNWQMRGGFVHAEFWHGTAACHDFSLLQEMVQANTHLPVSSYIYLSTCQSMTIYPYLWCNCCVQIAQVFASWDTLSSVWACAPGWFGVGSRFLNTGTTWYTCQISRHFMYDSKLIKTDVEAKGVSMSRKEYHKL